MCYTQPRLSQFSSSHGYSHGPACFYVSPASFLPSLSLNCHQYPALLMVSAIMKNLQALHSPPAQPLPSCDFAQSLQPISIHCVTKEIPQASYFFYPVFPKPFLPRIIMSWSVFRICFVPHMSQHKYIFQFRLGLIITNCSVYETMHGTFCTSLLKIFLIKLGKTIINVIRIFFPY